MTTAARLQVVVAAETSAAEKGLAALGAKVESAGAGFARVFGLAAAAGVAGVTAALGGAVKEASDFEKTMSGVAAVSGATAGELKQLADLALKLGADTSFSAKEAAEGLEELTKAGVSMGDIMGGAAKASLDLAAAGGVSVADAATIAANAMNQFSIKGSEMGHIADLIAGAANASALDVNDFKYSLQAAGAVAATVGFSFDDLAQAIAVMGQAGITGSDAGTSLKTMMMGLQPQTKEQTKLFRDLGLMTKDGANAFFDASGKVKSMAEVAQVLQGALKGQTEQQKLATLETLFGSDAIRAAAVMAKAGASGFEDMAAAMGKVSAADVAEKRLDNLAGSIEKFWGSVSTAAIVVGSKLTPMVRSLVDFGTSTLNAWLPTIEAFAEMVPGAVDATWRALTDLLDIFRGGDSFDAAYEAIAKILPESVALRIVDNVQAMGEAWRGFGRVAVWFGEAAWSAFGRLDRAINAYGAAAGAVLVDLGQIIGEFVGLELDDYAAGWDTWGGIVVRVGELAETAIADLSDMLTGMLGSALTWLTDTGWPAWKAAAETVVGWVVGTAIPGLKDLWEWLSPKFQAALNWLADDGWPALKSAAAAAVSWLTTTGVSGLRSTWDWLSQRVGAALTWLTEKGWPLMQSAGAAVWTWLTSSLIPSLSSWWGWLYERLGRVYTWFIDYGWPMLQSAGATVWTWLTESLFPALGEWWTWLQERLSPIYSWFIDYGWPSLLTAGAAVWTWLTESLFPALSEWWVWFQDRLSPIYSWFIDYGWPALQSAGAAMWKWLSETLFPTLRDWWVWFQERLSPIFSWFIDYGWPALLKGAKNFGDFVNDKLIGYMRDLRDELAKTDTAESWVTIFENLGKFGHYLVNTIDLGGWFSQLGSGASAANGEVGYMAQAIAWISRTLAKWSKLLPGVDVPEVSDPPAAPRSGGSGGGTNFRGGQIAAPPGRSTGGGGGSGGGSGGGGGGGSGGGGLIPTNPYPMPAPTPQPEPEPVSGTLPTDPSGWFQLAKRVGGEFNVPSDTFAKQMRHESAGFAQDVILQERLSSAGARGIAQFMTPTGNGVADRMGVSRAAFWESPLLQLRGGAFHMRELLDMMGNNIIKALVGYNAGPRDALTLTPGREIWELENIWKSKEPRRYIKAILGMAEGGIVSARPGGIIANIGEGGRDEAVLPLPRNWRNGGLGGGRMVYIDNRGATFYGFEDFDQRVLKSINSLDDRGYLPTVVTSVR